MMDNEPFSNPLAPPSAPVHKQDYNHVSDRSQPLTNDDFRKLMMTPRSVGSNHNAASISASVRGSTVRNKHGRNYKPQVEQNENAKKKKKIYEMIRKQEGDVLHELAKKYRDRAKERREGTKQDIGRSADLLSNTAYHAVGPDNLDMDAAERRQLLIQESKYLGGDMEHTHLVKGLDYALLQKVKAEIQSKKEEEEYYQKQKEEKEAEARREEERGKKNLSINKKPSQSPINDEDDEEFDDQDRYAIKSKKVENLLKVVFRQNIPDKNELFLQGRMAYQYDLVSEYVESEVPTTIIRSKAECPHLDAYNSTSTNQIIINKLIQIWTDIHQGASKKQRRKLDQSSSAKCNQLGHKSFLREVTKSKSKDDNIYDDVEEYVPDIKPKSKPSSSRDHLREKRSYFETSKQEQENLPKSRKQTMELAASVVGSLASSSNIPKVKRGRMQQQEPESYAECYPGAPENDDAILDSDDDFDDGKMDTKKLKNRSWDNADGEDYGGYDKEGGQTSRHGGMNKKDNQKAKLDREYQKINALINKKKQQGEKIGMSYLSKEDHYSKNY